MHVPTVTCVSRTPIYSQPCVGAFCETPKFERGTRAGDGSTSGTAWWVEGGGGWLAAREATRELIKTSDLAYV